MKKLKKLLIDSLDVPEEKIHFLPGGFQQVGDIAILNPRPEIRPYVMDIAGLILERFPRFKTVCEKRDIVRGELRIPSVRVITGEERTVTKDHENLAKRMGLQAHR